MRIRVKAKPKAKKTFIKKVEPLAEWAGETHFIVAVTEAPTGGQANAAIARAVANYFGVAPSRVRIVSGAASRDKVLEID